MSKPFILRPIGLGLLATMLVLSADQVSKYWILYGLDLPNKGSVALLPFLNFTMVWNHAVTFGMFGGMGGAGRIVFSAIALAVAGVLLVWMARTPSKLTATCVGAITGGAIGNVMDRLRYGAVVDFIHAHAFGWSWYVFNVADSAIVCAVCVLLVQNVLAGKEQQAT
ncbi:lipoprotein signal peptidase [Acetobacter orientalis]|uniref:Lipoprotein signal peptidase n=2 Tax=Acetobacter orientalis TaxID=146474 RepID=A0A252AZ62_9PROT|nr:lipoprotein signal peptidase [Acetobacter orientalis]BBC79400.1 lipoprotein signal peptidase [Acetobacter orientalis]GAN67094.1 lipoprotein signal peptidase [Acetobacter orientalis]GBR18745.1 lipoprotein signal peptidase [Acetobacter orientalis NRIC 0481]GEL60972.1 lipoprotein signal peptidase [Acetobacter orientalis]